MQHVDELTKIRTLVEEDIQRRKENWDGIWNSFAAVGCILFLFYYPIVSAVIVVGWLIWAYRADAKTRPAKVKPPFLWSNFFRKYGFGFAVLGCYGIFLIIHG